MVSAKGGLESDRMRGKEKKKKKKKRETKVEENIRHKYEEKQVRENKDKLRGLESCEALVHSILAFEMDHINNIKVKELQVLHHYHFGIPFHLSNPK